MDCYTIDWFKEMINKINQSKKDSKYFNQINCVFQIEIDDEVNTFYAFDHAIQSVTNKPVYHHIDFKIVLNNKTWTDLLKDKIKISQAISPVFKSIKVIGSPVAFSANLYYLNQLVKLLNKYS